MASETQCRPTSRSQLPPRVGTPLPAAEDDVQVHQKQTQTNHKHEGDAGVQSVPKSIQSSLQHEMVARGCSLTRAQSKVQEGAAADQHPVTAERTATSSTGDGEAED